MTDPLQDRLRALPADPEAARRTERLREAGIGNQPVADFDKVAAALAANLDMPYAMVNFIGEDEQYFAGLFAGDADAAIANSEAVGRTMPKDHGYCPEVVRRGTALPLGNVLAAARFAGNPVVNLLGIHSYLGAPIIGDDGEILGTVCVVGKEPRTWGKPDVDLIKETAKGIKELINERTLQRSRVSEQSS